MKMECLGARRSQRLGKRKIYDIPLVKILKLKINFDAAKIETVDYTSLALEIRQVGLAITNVSIITTIIAITVSILYCSIMNKDFN